MPRKKNPTKAQHSLKNLYSRPGFLLRRANQISASLFSNECQLLTPPQFTALSLVSWVAGIDQIAISRIMGFDRSTTALVVSNLIKSGLIMREQDKDDRRRFHLFMTTKGERVIEEVVPAAERAHQRLISIFSKTEQKTLCDLLDRLVTSFNDAAKAPIDEVALIAAQHRIQRIAPKRTKVP